MNQPSSRFLSVKEITVSALFVALLSISAQLKIPLPFYPIPFTLQNIAVILCGLLLPRRCALSAILTYVLLGLLGAPIFSGGGGFQYLFSPAFGYLIGFIVAIALLCSIRPSGQKSRIKTVIGCLLATLSIHLFGSGYFYFISAFVQHTPHALKTTLSMFGLFFPLDVVKFILAIFIALPIESRLRTFLTFSKAQPNSR